MRVVDTIVPCSRTAAAEAFFTAWSLLLMPVRTPEMDADLLRSATLCAERLALLDEPAERVRGEWLMARALTALGRYTPALVHAHRAERLADALGMRGLERFRTRAALACASDHAHRGAEARHWLHLAAATLADMSEDQAAQATRDLDRLFYHHG